MTHDTAANGFTLLELMVVCGVLAVLFGLAVGFLGKTDPRLVADSVIGGELRAARFTARAEGVPTEVMVTPGVLGEPARVQSRLLESVASFHFEPNEPVEDPALRGQVGGVEVQGRFGAGRRNRDGDKTPLLRWSAPPRLVDFSAGFALRVDLLLEARAQCTVLRFGQTIELWLDDDGVPRVRLRLTGGTAQAAAVATLQSELPLPLRRWCTLDVVGDGRECWLVLDGRELARAVADGVPLQDEQDVFDVSPGDRAVPGIVDEVRVLAYAFGPAQMLPTELQPDRPYRIVFDARGEALTSTEVKLLLPEEGQ